MADSVPIRAAMVGCGKSDVKFHALKANGNAACSSYLYVVFVGDLAANITKNARCKSKACAALFAIADQEVHHG